MFPDTNSSQTIIDCFMNTCKQLGIILKTQQYISKIEVSSSEVVLQNNEEQQTYDQVIICAGGHPKRSGLDWLATLGLEIIDPLPSLFTFNMPKNPISALMGTVVPNATVKIEGTKLSGQGPILITHWGMSGPAVLLLSAWGARLLAEKNYQFAILVNWLDEKKKKTCAKIFCTPLPPTAQKNSVIGTPHRLPAGFGTTY